MKQHITWEQMKESNIPKLRHLINNNIFDDLLVGYFNKDTEAEGLCYLAEMAEIITIGKMIEILSNKGIEFNIENPLLGGKILFWRVKIKNIYPDYEFNGTELADELWKAVKYVLEEETNES